MAHRDFIVTDEEAAKVGLSLGRYVNTWLDRIRPILIAKGCPERELKATSMTMRVMPRGVDDGRTVFRLTTQDEVCGELEDMA